VHNRQIHTDFGFRLAVTTPETFINVPDFDLTALKRYVRDIDKRISNNAHFDITAGHKLIVNLHITASWARNPDVLALEHDCKWLSNKTKPHNFNIVYRTKHVEDLQSARGPMDYGMTWSSCATFGVEDKSSGWGQIKWSFPKYAWEAYSRGPLELERQVLQQMEVQNLAPGTIASQQRQVQRQEDARDAQLQQWASEE